MKTIKIAGIFILLLVFSFATSIHAQADARPAWVAISQTHWNFDLNDETATREEWAALSKEYKDKVTMKNEFIRSTSTLSHMYTGDNSEVLLVTVYNTWEDIEKAQDRNTELEEAAWPNKAAREAFLKKIDRYFVNRHADEIYRTLPGAKVPATSVDTTRVIYMQKTQRAFPSDGTTEELDALTKEYTEKVIHKNPYLIAYYPMRHGWGADNRELVDVFVLNSLCDVAAMNQAIPDLEKAAWPDEAARKAFFKKFDKYFTGIHGDYIYTSIAGVSK